MENHYQLSDIEFETSFENCGFEVSMFSHEAHLRLAWIHIRRYGPAIAEKNVSDQLRAYTKHVGAADKFNLTLTIAAVKAVYHFYLRYQGIDFKDFIHNSPLLMDDFKGLMDRHYRMDIFSSELARQRYLVPDLAPFD
ncbi:hypothetical protein [Lutimonas sp.]|uniref:hypothetical protein n=1 Tax=Lutimonas sp. TaxID=1872403 RepID=UPI003D9AF445